MVCIEKRLVLLLPSFDVGLVDPRIQPLEVRDSDKSRLGKLERPLHDIQLFHKNQLEVSRRSEIQLEPLIYTLTRWFVEGFI